jgi:hypothetical protein
MQLADEGRASDGNPCGDVTADRVADQNCTIGSQLIQLIRCQTRRGGIAMAGPVTLDRERGALFRLAAATHLPTLSSVGVAPAWSTSGSLSGSVICSGLSRRDRRRC